MYQCQNTWAGALLGGFAFLIWAGMIALMIVGWWQILKKAGFHPALSLLFIVPVANLVIFLIVAFSTWPAHRKSPAEPGRYTAP